MVALLFLNSGIRAQQYPRGYFRHPLNIPLQLVANFGEIRANHWHMGLDIRTQQKVNLPVYASAEGYIARVSVEPGGFGQAIYINHPNGYTTLYAHLNAFFPELAQYIKQQQYAQQSWRVNLELEPGAFPVTKGQYIALSGSTGGSQGPHVHFEIRDTKTGKCLNPLLFQFPIADGVPPTVYRVAMYDRSRSTWLQSPQMITNGASIRTGSNRISFAVGAVDRFSGTPNPNGIFSAKVSVDGSPVSEFLLDSIDYIESRYINAQVDYRYKAEGGSDLQHISPLPGARVPYRTYKDDGIVVLGDTGPHTISIDVRDAAGNSTKRNFTVRYDPALARSAAGTAGERLLPNNVNVFERPGFELFTTEATMYDTVPVVYATTPPEGGSALSATHRFLSASIPSHDYFTVRIKPETELSAEDREQVVIKNVSGTKTFVQKATWNNGWLTATFRQFGTFQAIIDREPPTVNAPPTNLTRARSIVFTPKDNMNSIKSFRVELDGQWLRFTNDKGRTWVYGFDEHFPRGTHELKVIVVDEAGNKTTRSWRITR